MRRWDQSDEVGNYRRFVAVAAPRFQHFTVNLSQGPARAKGAHGFIWLKVSERAELAYQWQSNVAPLIPTFVNLFTYVAQITYDKNHTAHYLVSIGYAFIRINERTLFWSSEFVRVCTSVRILLLNTISVFPCCSDSMSRLDNCIST